MFSVDITGLMVKRETLQFFAINNRNNATYYSEQDQYHVQYKKM